tara:strand:+ start:4814 stop:5149 length:336 start_codon:yes stop_codon:yes gene_type:complete
MKLITERLDSFFNEKAERTFDPEITLQQLTTNALNVGCWGAHDFVGYRDSVLYFKVNGALHKGFVVIILNYMDTYDIYLLNKDAELVGKGTKDIYADMLNEVVDNLVETPN